MDKNSISHELTHKSFLRKLNKLANSEVVSFIKGDLIKRLGDSLDGRPIKDILGDSDFKRIAAFYNEAVGTETNRKSVTPQEVAARIDIVEFAAITVARQNTWLMLARLDEIPINASTVAGFRFIFGDGSNTVLSLTNLVKRITTRYEQLAGVDNNYLVTPLDVEDALR